MLRRPLPSSLWWLIALILACFVVAAGAGFAMYQETQERNRIRAELVTGGDWRRGRAEVEYLGCGSCHVIPGIDGAVGKVGPDLAHVGQRATLAGSFPNGPQAMTLWILHPQALRPGSGMPEQGISARQARDIAAFLYAQN